MAGTTKDMRELIAGLRAFNAQARRDARENAEMRRGGVGLMTPRLLREHIRSGQDLVLAYGRRGDTVTYTPADLMHFKRMIERTQAARNSAVRGIPYAMLWSASDGKDKKRSRSVRSATLYRIEGDTMCFRVSGNSRPFYLVRIRMDEWKGLMKAADGTWEQSARKALFGRLSIDCACGRHQFWYRYLAGIGNYAVAPPDEHDFPKIRNPRLKGCCCKHVLKCLQVMKGAGILRILAREMERQADTVGYGDTVRAHMLTVEDIRAARRAKGAKTPPKEAARALADFRAEASEMLSKASGTEKVRDLRRKATVRKPKGTVEPKTRIVDTGAGKSATTAGMDERTARLFREAVAQTLKLRAFGIDVTGTLRAVREKFGASEEEMRAALDAAGEK